MLSADFFPKSTFSKKNIQEYLQSGKQFESRSGQHFVRPDLGPNCLERLSADETSRQRVHKPIKL